MCRSTSALIVRLGASLIYAPFGPLHVRCVYDFMVSIIKRLPALELFLGAPVLEIIRYHALAYSLPSTLHPQRKRSLRHSSGLS